MGIFAAFNIFSIKIPYPSVGSATHNQAKRVCKLACERVSADCSAVARRKTSEVHSTKRNACTAKEYNVRHRADELAVLYDRAATQ